MLLNGKTEINVLDRSLAEIVEEITAIHPTPESLLSTSLLFLPEEEAALDAALHGIMWPAYFARMLTDWYEKRGMPVIGKGFSANMVFPDGENFLLTFKKTEK